MVQYYTLEQAAQILRTTPDQLKEMARKKEVRAFQDRSGWRFRVQEIDELARARGYGSDPDLPLGEGQQKTAGDSGGKEVFNFSLEVDDSADVPIGKEPTGSSKSSSRSPGPRKPGASKLGPKSEAPKPSSDSDVRLVMDGSDMNFSLEGESKAPASKAPFSPPPKTGSSKSKLGKPGKRDSVVRIVPLDEASDSDVKIVPSSPHDSDIPISKHPAKKQSDSDIRIEELARSGRRDQMVTEEIDLDAEQRKAEAAGPKSPPHKPKGKGGSPVLPTSSPFELSENDLDMDRPTIPPPAPRAPEEAEADTDSSSDFELKPLGDSSSPLDVGSDELPVMRGDDEVGLGELTGAKGGSGINLQDPVDSGISLEEGGSDEIEFELSLEGGNTPKPAPAKEGTPDSSSEFELSLQEDDSSPTDGSSEFELSLDPEGSSELAVDDSGSSDLGLETPAADSDSEFELTLDETGGLSVEEDSSSEEDKDIFETDFEVPALNEESGSEAVALDEADTDLESSEFDLSLDGEGSGSQVVPLEDEEEYEEGEATVQRPAAGAAVEDDEGLEDLGEALDEDLDQEPVLEEEGEGQVAVSAAAAPPAEWGAMPALVMIPCTIVLFVVGLMSFELIQGMWGYHKGSKVSNLVIHPIAKMFDDKLPDD